MKLWDDAITISLAGIDLYAFGLFCMIGAVATATAVWALCRGYQMEKASAGILTGLMLLCGALVSRIGFCLMNQSLGCMMPLASWFRITEGGWSLSGMILGALAGSRMAAAVFRVPPKRTMDITVTALPLMIAAIKYAEEKIPDFDISRPLGDGFPAGISILTVQDEYGTYLATRRVGLVLALVLFFILVFSLLRKNRKDGDQGILFLLLCGAGGILLESLRYDHFLEFSFVRLQMVLYAGILVWGTVLAIRQDEANRKGLRRTAIITCILAIGICGGIEFALDRMSINHVVLYVIMIAALAVPVSLGCCLLRRKEPKSLE